MRDVCPGVWTAMVAMAAGGMATVVLVGCGGIVSPDLFLVERSGSTPGAKLTLVVNEEGGVRCNGGKELKLSDPQIVQARALQEELKGPAESRLALAAGPGSVLQYRVRDENGSLSFADDSPGQPKVLRNLALFVLQVAQSVCGLSQQGA